MDDSNSSAVVVFTPQHRISGRIALLPGARLTDYIKHAGDFMAMTDVEVCTHEGKELFTTGFLDIATRAVEIIMPAEQFKAADG